MQYTILIYENPADFAARADEAKQGPYWAAWGAYAAALNQGRGVRQRGRADPTARGHDRSPYG